MEKLDGNEDLVAGFGLIEEDDGFEVVAEGYAAAVEVDDLRHGAVGVGVKGEPDARAGEVVPVEGFGYFNLSAVPDGIVGRFAAGFDDGPVAVVEIEGLAVRKVARVIMPLLRLELVKARKTLDDLLRLWRKRARNLSDLLSRLCVRGGRRREKWHCNQCDGQQKTQGVAHYRGLETNGRRQSFIGHATTDLCH